MKTESPEIWTDKSRRPRVILGGLVFVANLAAAYIAFAPLEFQMPRYGLDPSWVAVLGEAPVHGWRFGRDIIFTLGPYACTYTGQYHPATDHLMLIGADSVHPTRQQSLPRPVLVKCPTRGSA